MAFTVDPITGKISFGVVSDGTSDGVARDLASEFGVSEDFNDDFTTDLWTDVGTDIAVNTVTEIIDWDSLDETVNHATYFDLGVGNVSDTVWLLRFKLDINTLTNGSTGQSSKLFVGLSDLDGSTDSDTAKDWVGFNIEVNNVVNQFRAQATDGTSPNDAGGGAFGTASVGTIYAEIQRTSATTAVLNLYSDAEYTALIVTQAFTPTANIASLRYLIVQNGRIAGSDSVLDGSIDDVQFWNSKTVPTISSTNWRLRFKLDLTNIDDGASATDKTLFFGLGDSDGLASSSVLQDGYFLRAFTNTGPDAFHALTPDNEAPRTKVADSVMGTTPSVSTKWIELVRDSASQITTTIYTESTFTTIDSTATTAGISGTDNLKYLRAFNDNVASASGAIDGSIDDITFDDLTGAVTPTETFTVNVILNALDQEKTFLIDAFIQSLGDNGCATGFSDDFTTATEWTEVGNGSVTITGGKISGWGPGGSSIADNRLTHDLGSVLSDIRWKAEFEYIFTASAIPSHTVLALTDSSDDPDGTGTHDTLGVHHGTGANLLRIIYVDEGLISSDSVVSDGITVSTSTTYYPRLERLSATESRLSVYSDAGRTTHITGSPVSLTIPSTVDSLQYIHSMANSGAGDSRSLTGTIDNLSINNCPSFSIDSLLFILQEETFLVDAILIARTCSPWLNFANGDGSTQRITRNAGVGQGIEFPLVNVDTYVSGFKIRLQRVGGATGSFNCKIFTYPPSQGSGGAIAVVGTSNNLSGASISGVLTEETAVFDPPVLLSPNQRYMIGFSEGLDSGTGINYETRITTGTQFQYSFQHPVSGSPPNWINLLSTDRQIAGDILVLNGDEGLCITVNAILTKLTAWQFREQRTRNDQLPTGGGPVIAFSNEPTRLNIDSTTGSIGFGWVFKTFLLSEITGSTIKADWAGTGTAQIRVYDGRYDRKNFGDFVPKDDSQNPIAVGILKGAGLLGSIEEIAPSGITTLSAGSINYAGALLEEVTVFIKLNDVSNAVASDLNISSITVTGNDSVYNFTNPTLVQENTATEFDWGFVDATSITIPSVDKTFLVDGILIVRNTETFLVDAILKATFTETFLVDTFSQAVKTATFIVDGFKQVMPSKSFIIDGTRQAFDLEETYAVDSRLIVRRTFGFIVDGLIQAKPQIPFEFIVDGIVRYGQGTPTQPTGGIPDLIIRVLRENPPSLTGQQIIDEIVIITSDPAEGFSFRGKTSRIKNWLNRLLLDNLILNDDSNPDWYRTNWSLNPAVFP